MITGTYNDRVQLKGVAGSNNAVACIKEIRTWSTPTLGLKEAKDIYDRLRNRDYLSSPSTEFIKVKHEDYANAMHGLRNVGFTV